MLVYLQVFWSDNIRDRFFYKQYILLQSNPIQTFCNKIDNFFNKYTFILIKKDCIVETIGYNKWRIIDRDKWNLKKFKRYKAEKHVWHTYFDFSMGIFIDSSSKIRQIEKERGFAYITDNEYNEIVKKSNKEIKEKRNEKLRKRIEQNVSDLYRGRSFAKELRDKING